MKTNRKITNIMSVALAAAFAASPLVAPSRAADAPAAKGGSKAVLAARPGSVRGDELSPEVLSAIEKGMEFLSKKQARDGSFGFGEGGGGHAGITALGGIAFMAAGNLPGRGKYADNVQKAVNFVMQSTQESGVVATDNQNPMYGHGFATVFLGEVYGMTGDEEVKAKLRKAVDCIQKAQNNEGGWRYSTQPTDADISCTICQIMGLRAARDAGMKVEKEVIDNAIKYVRKCQNQDGGFGYMPGQGSGYARTAAGVASLYYAGVFEGDELKKGLDMLKGYLNSKGGGDMEAYYFYGQYYAAQATFLAGGQYWDAFWPMISKQLLERQNKQSGGWQGDPTEDYATAMALIILQMPNRYLPVFHAKGPGQ